jgi:protease I
MRVLNVCCCHFNLSGNELFTALSVIKSAGHTFEVRSTDTVIEDEVTGDKRRLKQTIYDSPPDPDTFDGLMFTSGTMRDSEAYWTNLQALEYVRAFAAFGKPVAAICITVPVLIPAIKGRTVTCFPLIREKDLLRRAGAVLSPVSMVRDGNVVTAENQMATQIWAEEFVALMEGRPPVHTLTDCDWREKTIPRKDIPILQELQRKQGRRDSRLCCSRALTRRNAASSAECI